MRYMTIVTNFEERDDYVSEECVIIPFTEDWVYNERVMNLKVAVDGSSSRTKTAETIDVFLKRFAKSDQTFCYLAVGTRQKLYHDGMPLDVKYNEHVQEQMKEMIAAYEQTIIADDID